MLSSLRNIFLKNEDLKEIDNLEHLNILCGLMMEAANTDGSVTKEEINKISDILIHTFKESREDVEKVLNESLQHKDESRSLYFFTSKINKIFSDEKKILLIETLWEIILADGEIHDFESNLIRRLAGLLYISDVTSGKAKKKALEKNKTKIKSNDIYS